MQILDAVVLVVEVVAQLHWLLRQVVTAEQVVLVAAVAAVAALV
jgi:hypothetical protein